jgi:hypothetical protein
MIPHPPSINPQLKQKMRLRYTVVTTPAKNKLIQSANVLGSVVVATSAIATYNIYDTVRLESVEVWSAPSQGSAPATVAVQFPALNSPGNSGRVYSDTSMGIEPAYVKAVPDKLSNAGFWQESGSADLFYLTAPIGSVIDVVVSFATDQNAAPVASVTPGAATTGEMYYVGLDNLLLAATTLPAVAPVTI